MVSISHIRKQANFIPDDDLRGVCLKVIDEVEARVPRKNQGLWTIDVISKWVGKDATDPIVIRGIQFLASKIDAQLLEMHFFFVDPDQEEGVDEMIDDNEVMAAYKTGFLIHPIDGRQMPDFEGLLLPYFVPAQGLTLR